MTADDAHRLVDLGPPAGVHAVDVALDLADEVPDPADFPCCGHRVGTGPLIDPVDAGGQPFAGAQQVIEIPGQVRKVGDVGAEVVTAGAAEPDRAGTPWRQSPPR